MFGKKRNPLYVLVDGINAAVDTANTLEAARIKARENSLLVKLWADHKGCKRRVMGKVA